MNLNWSRKDLTPQKLGTFGEYYAKMTMASYGMSIYTSEVDDHGIDFVAEFENRFLKFQVKTIRGTSGYVFMKAADFSPDDPNFYLLLLCLADGEYPKVYMIPANAWHDPTKTMFVYHAYENRKSKPEYGINLSKKNEMQLESYRIEKFFADTPDGLNRA